MKFEHIYGDIMEQKDSSSEYFKIDKIQKQMKELLPGGHEARTHAGAI